MTQRSAFNKEVDTKEEDKKIEQKSILFRTSFFFNPDVSPFLEFLDEDDAATMCFVSKEFDQTNSPYQKAKINTIQSLFKLIAMPTEKNIKEAKRMVERNYGLLLTKMPTTVAYGQELKGSFSALQRISSYGDFFLAEELLTYLPEEANSIAAAQLKEVVTRNDFLAPYRNLINGYKEFNIQYDAQLDRNNLTRSKELLKKPWLDLIGKRQRLLPEFALQQFCSTTPLGIGHGFYYGLHGNILTTFDHAPERRFCQLYDRITEGGRQYISLNRKSLGVDFALYRGNEYFGARHVAEGAGRGGAACLWWLDLDALKHLCKVIESKFGIIIKRLDPTFELEAKETSHCLIL